jgi:cellulose synthase/poly-beta-1,6-N-acetylglucosamine synthase-like glycosyltransferase
MNQIIHLTINILFLFSVVFIWLMLIYQFILSIGGFLWKHRLSKIHETKMVDTINLPTVSILIPARNEGMVIEATVRRMIGLDYPADKCQIIVINDGSTDNTGEIVRLISRQHYNVTLLDVPEDRCGRGKGAALNFAMKSVTGDVVAVYDADNIPHRDSLKNLIYHLNADPRLAAVTGKFRAYNRGRNLLTRMINIEGISFQWIVQAGRWFFLKISLLPGTNFVIRKAVINEVGGWDEEALTEDTELTFRLYQRGYIVKFVPNAVTEEQEPEKLSTWIRQRIRWARGNNQIISKFSRSVLKKSNRLISIELLNLFYLYYFFIFAILFSDFIFVMSLFDIVHIDIVGPYAELWMFAFLLYLLEILIALHFEGEDSISNVLYTIFAYFTYTKLWVLVVLISLYQDIVQKKDRIWHKTERFDTPDKE